MGVLSLLQEQLTKPIPNAVVLVNLNDLSTGVSKLLPMGSPFTLEIIVTTCFHFFHENWGSL